MACDNISDDWVLNYEDAYDVPDSIKNWTCIPRGPRGCGPSIYNEYVHYDEKQNERFSMVKNCDKHFTECLFCMKTDNKSEDRKQIIRNFKYDSEIRISDLNKHIETLEMLRKCDNHKINCRYCLSNIDIETLNEIKQIDRNEYIKYNEARKSKIKCK